MKCAFFDVDNTVLNFKSMFLFQDYFFEHTDMYEETDRKIYWDAFNEEFNKYFAENKERLFINKKYYERFKGRSEAEVRSLAKAWFDHELKHRSNEEFWVKPVKSRLDELKAQGVRIVLISGSCYEILEPLMDLLDVQDCISTNLEVENGIYTGKIIGRQIIGENKGISIREMAEENSYPLEECAAFGDHISDASMHRLVGMPIVVEGDPSFEAIAEKEAWEIIRYKEIQQN